MMKKLLLFVFALAIMGSTIAQKAGRQQAVATKHSPTMATNVIDKETSNTGNLPTTLFQNESKGNTALATTLIGSARNIYGGLLVFQNCLTYNKDLDNIMFTHRGNDKGTLVPFGTGNDIITAFSADRGTTFTQKIAMTNGLANRYPSGVFYNPTGNTDTANVYTLVAGPLNTNSVWNENYYHSGKYDGTGQNHQEFATDATYLELMRNGLTATTDGGFHISGIGTVLNSAQTGYTDCRVFDMNGTWNTTTKQVDWAAKGEITPNIVAASTGLIYVDGSYTKAAWSKDGSVGYLMMLAGDNRPASKPSITPIIWKSTDKGTTWTILDYFNWSTVPAIREHIYPTNMDTSVYKPYFEEASIVLDANDKPHIFGMVRGASSSNVDSLNYIWTRTSTGTMPDGNIIELYLDNTNAWKGTWVDSISAESVPYTKSPYVSSPDNIGWDHRLTASTNDGRDEIFASWTDSDWIFWGTEAYDFNPDLKVWRHNINSTSVAPSPVNLTANTDLWGLVFFHFTAPEVIQLDPTTYELPLVIADINTSGLQADEPVYYKYVSGADVVLGTNDHAAAKSSIASACYPNPFSGSTKVDVTVEKAANVTISVTDITGQMISSTNYGTMTTGKHTITFDGTNLHSGVYLYSVTVGDQKFNSKMIIK